MPIKVFNIVAKTADNVGKERPVKVLFVYKERSVGYGVVCGLVNSATMTAKALSNTGVFEAEAVQATDGNSIDRLVKTHRPHVVILEALWVTPEKLKELCHLYPQVRWIVRLHSKTSFLATEGIALDWMHEYFHLSNRHDVAVAANSQSLSKDVNRVWHKDLLYLPNIYVAARGGRREPRWDDETVNIGCFGAIRPLKNTLKQGFAAIAFAEDHNKKLHFHVNGNHTEQYGESVLKNLRALFRHSEGHSLVEHDWMPHSEFVQFVQRMDLGMQVSYTETFNITAADFVWNEIPLVGSHEIEWLPSAYQADPNSLSNIVEHLHEVWKLRAEDYQAAALHFLMSFNRMAEQQWRTVLQVLHR